MEKTDLRPSQPGALPGVTQLQRELHATRAALQAIEDRARYLYDRSPVICFILDSQGTIIDCNERALRALSQHSSDVVGRPLWDLCEEEGGDRLRGCLLSLSREETASPALTSDHNSAASRLASHHNSGASRFEIEVRLRTGPKMEDVLDASALLSAMWAKDGTPIEVHALLTDVSEVRRLERRMAQADRLASVGQLAAGVAHEINNPAAFVMANLGHLQARLPLLKRLVPLLPDADADGALRELLDDLPDLCDQSLQGMRRIRDIVRDLQIFARPADEPPEPVDLSALCDTVANMAWPQVRRHARLEKSYGEVPPIHGHLGKLSQVLMNLMINGAQAIPEGQQARNKIVIATGTRDDGAIISVTDTGAGIPQAVIGRIFDPFFTTKPPGKGTGLGLSVSYEIIQAHGGRMEVQSQVGVGTTFTVWLPTSVMAEGTGSPRAAARGEPKPAAQKDKVRGKVLVVDDEPELLRAFSRTLREEHQVLLAESVSQALGVIRAHPDVDAILCDLMMPDQSGMDFYETLPRALRERLIFISGDTGSRGVRAFLQSSGAEQLTKPVELEALRMKVAALVSRCRSRG